MITFIFFVHQIFHLFLPCISVFCISLNAPTRLVGWQERYLACNIPLHLPRNDGRDEGRKPIGTG